MEEKTDKIVKEIKEGLKKHNITLDLEENNGKIQLVFKLGKGKKIKVKTNTEEISKYMTK